MLDVQTVDRVQFKRHQVWNGGAMTMAEQSDDPDAAADRLEAALERIAQRLAEPRAAPPAALPMEPAPSMDVDESALSAEEIAERLDALIVRLRAALGRRSD